MPTMNAAETLLEPFEDMLAAAHDGRMPPAIIEAPAPESGSPDPDWQRGMQCKLGAQAARIRALNADLADARAKLGDAEKRISELESALRQSEDDRAAALIAFDRIARRGRTFMAGSIENVVVSVSPKGIEVRPNYERARSHWLSIAQFLQYIASERPPSRPAALTLREDFHG